MTLSELAWAWWQWMLPMSIHVAVLATGIAAVDRIVGRRLWPRQRMMFFGLVLLRLVVLPGLESPLSSAPVAIPVVEVTHLAENSSIPAWTLTLFAIWVAGVGVIAALGWSGLRSHRRRWEETAVPNDPTLLRLVTESAELLRMKRLPRIITTAELGSPAVVGVFRPTLLVPAGLLNVVSENEGREILAHELAHIKHGDVLFSSVGVVLQVAYWFHPAVWWANRRVMGLREEACDLAAAQVYRGASAYRDTLVGFAARIQPAAPIAGQLCFFRPRAALRDRLENLERHCGSRAWVRRAVAATLLVGLATVLLPRTAVPARIDYSHLGAQGCSSTRLRVFAALLKEQVQESPVPLKGNQP